jgi:hypothetical protein
VGGGGGDRGVAQDVVQDQGRVRRRQPRHLLAGRSGGACARIRDGMEGNEGKARVQLPGLRAGAAASQGFRRGPAGQKRLAAEQGGEGGGKGSGEPVRARPSAGGAPFATGSSGESRRQSSVG